MTPVERVRADYSHTELTTGAHPMKLIRDQLNDVWPADELKWCATGQRVTFAGAVTCRPGVARRAVVFVTLEDETGTACLLRGRSAPLGAKHFKTGKAILRDRRDGFSHERAAEGQFLRIPKSRDISLGKRGMRRP